MTRELEAFKVQLEEIEENLEQFYHQQASTNGDSANISILRSQIVETRRKREDSAIESVYRKYVTNSSGIDQTQFYEALLEIRSDIAHSSEAKELFDNMDMNDDGLLDLHEFRRAVSSRSSFEQFISQLIPFAELVSAALPPSKDKSQLNVFLNLTEQEVAQIAGAVSFEIERIMSQKIFHLKKSYAAVQSRQSSNNSGSSAPKFSVDTISAGDITHYHKGLSGRVGQFINFAPHPQNCDVHCEQEFLTLTMKNR